MLKNAPNQADNTSIFQLCLLLKMRLSVDLEGRFTGYKYLTMFKKHEIDQKSVSALLLQDISQRFSSYTLIFSKYVSSLPEDEKITKIFLPVILSSSSHC